MLLHTYYYRRSDIMHEPLYNATKLPFSPNWTNSRRSTVSTAIAIVAVNSSFKGTLSRASIRIHSYQYL